MPSARAVPSTAYSKSSAAPRRWVRLRVGLTVSYLSRSVLLRKCPELSWSRITRGVVRPSEESSGAACPKTMIVGYSRLAACTVPKPSAKIPTMSSSLPKQRITMEFGI